jgi:DNA-binding NarL/FixJ family response regulator
MANELLHPLRVLLVDDHEVVREGLAKGLDRDPRFTVVGTAGTGEEALKLAGQLSPDVAIIDLRLPDTTGDRLCADLLTRLPDLAVVVLSSYLSEETVRNARAAGASGYVTKSAGLSALRDVLDGIAAGGRGSAPQAGVPQIVHQLHRLASERADRPILTPQQQTVLELAAEGLTYKQIGARLHIAASTVKFHIQNLKERLGVHSKAALIATAIRAGMISPANEDHLANKDHLTNEDGPG